MTHSTEEIETFTAEALEVAGRHGYVPAYVTTDDANFAPVFARTLKVEGENPGEPGPVMIAVTDVNGETMFKLLVKDQWFEQLKTPGEVGT